MLTAPSGGALITLACLTRSKGRLVHLEAIDARNCPIAMSTESVRLPVPPVQASLCCRCRCAYTSRARPPEVCNVHCVLGD